MSAIEDAVRRNSPISSNQQREAKWAVDTAKDMQDFPEVQWGRVTMHSGKNLSRKQVRALITLVKKFALDLEEL